MRPFCFCSAVLVTFLQKDSRGAKVAFPPLFFPCLWIYLAVSPQAWLSEISGWALTHRAVSAGTAECCHPHHGKHFCGGVFLLVSLGLSVWNMSVLSENILSCFSDNVVWRTVKFIYVSAHDSAVWNNIQFTLFLTKQKIQSIGKQQV